MSEKSTVIQGLDEEYHNIDIAEVKSPAAGELDGFHLVPTQDSETSPTTQSTALLDTGSLGFIDSTISSGPSPSYLRPHGRAASYLEGKGFGWLLEVEDEEEETKPLL